MKNALVITLTLGWLWTLPVPAQTNVCIPRIQWQQSFGGTGQNVPYALQQTSDRGYILAGYSDSPASGNKTGTNYGLADIWVVRLDEQGNKLWDRTYGGTSNDVGTVVQQTRDGGFIVGGWSQSGADGNKTTPSRMGTDAWLLRLDASGDVIWQKSYGGAGNDYVSDLQVTRDGGFIFAGNTTIAVTNTFYPDGWVVRLDRNGEVLWSEVMGSGDYDYFTSVQQTADGGFIAGGGQLGSRIQDFWVVRFSAGGATLWEKVYGSQEDDALAALAQTDDGGFLLAGQSYTSGVPEGDKTHTGFGTYDFWLVKIDATGNKIWDQIFGGNGQDFLQDMQLTTDGGALLGGSSFYSTDGNKTAPDFGNNDFWIVRVDSAGNKLWDASYGADGDDMLHVSRATTDGGFVLGGYSTPGRGGNKATLTFGIEDFWVVKLAPENDCDFDGVPNDRDVCPGTPAGAAVNADGCSIGQLCPCDGGWTKRAEYANCVKRVAAQFLDDHLITREQQHAFVQQALRAECPPGSVADAVLVFGLPHVPLGDATISGNPEDSAGAEMPPPPEGPLYVSPLLKEARNGVSVLLGEADSGLFVYPTVPSVADGYFMLGKAYGKVNGQHEQLISTIRGSHNGYATFPVEVDFSPIGVSDLTLQVFDGTTLVAEVEHALGSIAIFSENTPGQRANPFWRMPDGTIGALIELGQSRQIDYPRRTDSPSESPAAEASFPVYGNRIFIRANAPRHRVDYVSRMDIFGGGELPSFSIYDERLGMFGLPQKALGNALFEAADGRLTVRNSAGVSDDFTGVMVEASDAGRFDADLAALELINERATIQISAAVFGGGTTDFFQADLVNRNGNLNLGADFSTILGAGTMPVQVKVYRNGSLVGTAFAPNGTAANGVVAATIRGKTKGQAPALIACGVLAGDRSSPPFFALSFNHNVIVTAADGTELQGNHVRIQARAEGYIFALSAFSLGVINVPAFTLLDERTALAPPIMELANAEANLLLSWRHLNQPFILESASAPGGLFNVVTNDQEFIAEKSRLSLPVDRTSSRFFRLRLSGD